MEETGASILSWRDGERKVWGNSSCPGGTQEAPAPPGSRELLHPKEVSDSHAPAFCLRKSVLGRDPAGARVPSQKPNPGGRTSANTQHHV